MILVVGARPGSLGQSVVEAAVDEGFDVISAGLHEEELYLDVLDPITITRTLTSIKPAHVVCTVGVNVPAKTGAVGYTEALGQALRVNTYGPLNILDRWLALGKREDWPALGHFVTVSSNSARIARTASGPYCASKAALSMGVRVAAREHADPLGPYIWAVEPGFLWDTPMSVAVREHLAAELGEPVPMHRMPNVPGKGLNPRQIAEYIVRSIQNARQEINGACVRLDGGEQ